MTPTSVSTRGIHATVDPEDDDIFVPVTCTASTRGHLVNLKTGKVWPGRGLRRATIPDMGLACYSSPVRRKGSIGNIRSLNGKFFA